MISDEMLMEQFEYIFDLVDTAVVNGEYSNKDTILLFCGFKCGVSTTLQLVSSELTSIASNAIREAIANVDTDYHH